MSLPDRPPARMIRANEVEPWLDGFAFLSRARAEAKALRNTVQTEIAEAREAGRRDGRHEGEVESAELLLRTQAQVDAYLASIEPRVTELVFQILSEVLEGTSDGELIVRATRRALATFREAEGLTLSVPVAARAEVEAQLQKTHLRIVPDRHLTGRQCILTSPVSSVDISLDAQLQAIRTAMEVVW